MRELEAPTPNPEVKEMIARAARAEAAPAGVAGDLQVSGAGAKK
jgi:hypothetical protein